MKKILVMGGLVSLFAVGALQGCSDDDSGSSGTGGSGGSSAGGSGGSGTAGSGTAGTGTAGTGTAGTGTAGTGTAGSGGGGDAGKGGDAGAGGGGTPTLFCGKTKEEMPPISKCSDADASDCTKAMCADTGTTSDCKAKWEACEADTDCNKAISCFSICNNTGNPADAEGAIGTCSEVAGDSFIKAIALKPCNDGLTACGGDGSLDKK